jgi:translation initiation factor IF-2
MTDTNPSGASFAPVADSSAPAAGAETPAGNFGSTRGSGLARGKRQSSASAPAASTVKTDYKPTALEVITPQREYKNPFASPEPAGEPSEAPVEVKAPEAPAAVAEPVQAAAPQAPAAEEQVEQKSEIQILPPEEANRPAVNWESPSVSQGRGDSHSDDSTRRDERPTFRPDRREDQQPGAQPEVQRPRFEGRDPRRDFQRQPRDPRDARQPRDPRDARQPRDPREARQPRDPRDERQPRDPRDERPRYNQGPSGQATEPAKPSSGGFFGWLKGLFGGQKPAEAPAAPRETAGEPFGEGDRHRRRHRGGRGHGGQQQGYRGDRPEFGGDRPQGEQRTEHSGDRQGGPRRRRHRGGQGRGRGGEPRSEGQQGGGAI